MVFLPLILINIRLFIWYMSHVFILEDLENTEKQKSHLLMSPRDADKILALSFWILCVLVYVYVRVCFILQNC